MQSLEAFYAAVVSFTDRQLHRDDIRTALDAGVQPASQEEVEQSYREFSEWLLAQTIHRVSGASMLIRAMGMRGMPTSDYELRGELELQYFYEAIEATEAAVEQELLWAPITAFPAEETLPVHRLLAEFSWDWNGEVRMVWPLDEVESDVAGTAAAGDVVAESDEKTCADCAETIKAAANVCRFLRLQVRRRFRFERATARCRRCRRHGGTARPAPRLEVALDRRP